MLLEAAWTSEEEGATSGTDSTIPVGSLSASTLRWVGMYAGIRVIPCLCGQTQGICQVQQVLERMGRLVCSTGFTKQCHLCP